MENWPCQIEIDLIGANKVTGLIEIIKSVRSTKVENDVKPSKQLDILVKDLNGSNYPIDSIENDILLKMCKANVVESISGEVYTMPMEIGSINFKMDELVDKEAAKLKLLAEKEKLEKEITRGEKMLANERFISRAKVEKVEAERNKLANYQAQYAIVIDKLDELK